MSRFVDSVFSFLGRRGSKDQAVGDPVARRGRGGRKAVLKADSFVFLPGEGSGEGHYLWGEVITPRTVGAPLSSYSDDYSVLSSGERRKNVRSVLVDGSGKLVGRRLSGSFVAKAVRPRQSLDEVEDGSLEAFLNEFETDEPAAAADGYHTYDRTGESCVYDRLVHLPPPARPRSAGQGGRKPRVEDGGKGASHQLVLDLREKGSRRRASSGGSAEHFYSTEPEKEREKVDWEGLRETVEMTAIRGEREISHGGTERGESRSVKGTAHFAS